MRPHATRIGLTAAGRALVVLTLGAWLAGWVLPGARPLAAVGMTTLLVASTLALAATRGLELVGPAPARAAVGARLALTIGVRARGSRARTRSLLFALSEAGEHEGDAPAPAGFLEGRIRGESRPVQLAWRLRRRGWVTRLRVLVICEQPLGLVTVTRAFELPVRLLGLPRIGRLARELHALAPGRTALRGLGARGEEELSHVRDWREGESLHRMHWRLSARRGRPVLRELRAPAQSDVELVLDTHVPGLGTRRDRRASFERAVSLTATLAEHFLRQGRRLTLSIEGGNGARGLRGRPGLARALACLACVEPRAGAPRAEDDVRARRTGIELVRVRAGGPAAMEPAPHARGVLVLDVDAPRGHERHVAWTASAARGNA